MWCHTSYDPPQGMLSGTAFIPCSQLMLGLLLRNWASVGFSNKVNRRGEARSQFIILNYRLRSYINFAFPIPFGNVALHFPRGSQRREALASCLQL